VNAIPANPLIALDITWEIDPSVWIPVSRDSAFNIFTPLLKVFNVSSSFA